MDKMDIQAERRKTAEAVKKAEEAEREAEKRVVEAEREAEKRIEEAYDKGIESVIKTCKKLNATKEVAINQILETYARSLEETEKLVERYWN